MSTPARRLNSRVARWPAAPRGQGERIALRLALGGSDQLGERVGGHAVGRQHQERRLADAGHRLEVGLRVVARALQDVAAEREDAGAEQQRVAVRRRLPHMVAADGALTAGAVLDDDVGRQRGCQALRGESGGRVRLAARREGHDPADRAILRERLCKCGAAQQRQGQAGVKPGSTSEFHSVWRSLHVDQLEMQGARRSTTAVRALRPLRSPCARVPSK